METKKFDLKIGLKIILIMIIIQLVVYSLVVIPTELLARIPYLERSNHFILIGLRNFGWILPLAIFFIYAFKERRLSKKYKIFIWIFWFLISLALSFLIIKLDNNSFIGYCNEALEKEVSSSGLIDFGPCFLSGLYFVFIPFLFILLDFILAIGNGLVFLYKKLRKNHINSVKNKEVENI